MYNNTLPKTICDGCNHKEVCKWSNTLADLQKTVEAIELSDAPATVSVSCLKYSCTPGPRDGRA